MMKNLRYPLFLFLAGLLILASCHDDFLNNNQKEVSMLAGKFLISSQDPDPALVVELAIAGSSKFNITFYPKWMVWESMHGKFEKGITTLNFRVEKPEGQADSGLLTGTVLLNIERIGLIGLEVVYGNIGNIPGQMFTKITPVAGSVMDAVMHQPSGTLVIATQNPNQLMVFRPASAESFMIPLVRSPQCIDMLEDGKTVLVGNTTADVTQVSLESRAIIREYPLDCVAYDLVAGQNGWCYISPQGVAWEAIRSLDLNWEH